jgi:hypothetical protein
MHTVILCVAAAVIGTDYGWQRTSEGGMEYIIQFDTQTLESLRAGQSFQSDIPPSAGEVRAFRIVVGTEKLPQDKPLAPKMPEPAPKTLAPDPASKSLFERPAAYMEQPSASLPNAPQPKPVSEPAPEKPAAPWLPLTFTLLGLFASLGANIYLGWIAWDSRQRYLAKCSTG